MKAATAPIVVLLLLNAGPARGAEGGPVFKVKSKRRTPADVPAATDGAGPTRAPTEDVAARSRLQLGTGPSRGDNAETRCAACHQVAAWDKVRFNHDPTGFPLRGGHVSVTCGGCHPRGFDIPVADTCAGCHRDRHAGEFGLHCEGCHDDQSWKPLFQADAHRSTNFPLVGKHAVIPCQECHGNLRDRSFAHAAVDCVSCHQADYNQTKLTSIDHATAGFSVQCQSCHNTLRFWPARMEQHGACFRIASGSHHGIRCLGCHSSLTATTFTGACATGTFTCAGCHAHACARSDQQHTKVMGYQCLDAKCYECHKLTGQ